jgi:hypothetical protein
LGQLFLGGSGYNFAQMFTIRYRLGFATALAALCLAPQTAQAQSVPYWTSGWPSAFGSGFTAAQNSNTYFALSDSSLLGASLAGSSLSGIGLAGLDGSGAARGSFSSRFDLPNGWFVGSERGATALNGFGSAWNNMPSLSYEGTQFGYNFKNAEVPVSVYAGFGTLKYNTGINAPLPGFDSMSSANSPGYSAHVGVEFRPTSNLSLSVGASFAQQPQDTGINSLVASPFAYGRH